jgi:hypothetical protein
VASLDSCSMVTSQTLEITQCTTNLTDPLTGDGEPAGGRDALSRVRLCDGKWRETP